jgi:hypothetical protein
MLNYAVAVATGAWLALLLLVTVATRAWRPPPGPASLALRAEPPAVVSLLAGRLGRDGYPATLLDLVSRGWIGMRETEPGQIACWPREPDTGQLTDYERQALGHLAFRAGGMDTVPGAALGSGFEIGDDEFRQKFDDEVRADARRRGLLRRRIGPGTLALLIGAWLPAVTLALTDAARNHWSVMIFTPALCYLIILQGAFALYRRSRLSRAGRSALSAWLGFRVALIGSRSGRTAGTALLAAAGDRRIAYAAALGAAPDAVAAFAPDADRGHVWSSFGGSWHRVTLGSTLARFAPGPGMLLLVTLFCLPFAGVVLLAGEDSPKYALIAVLFPGIVWWGPASWVYASAARAARLPRVVEFDGQILRLWTEASGDESQGRDCCIAIDDGVRGRAWAMRIGDHTYHKCRAGQVVHVRIDPRANRLLDMSAAGTWPVSPPVPGRRS